MLVNNYETKSVFNKMNEISNQVSLEKPRNKVTLKSDIKPRDNYRHYTIENNEFIPF